MPSIDFDSLVPIDADSFLAAIIGFLGLSIVGAVLMFQIGLVFGPLLMRALMGVISRPGSLDAESLDLSLNMTSRDTDDHEAMATQGDDSQVQMFNEFIAERMAERAASRAYYGERWASELDNFRSRGDIGGLTDLWDNEMDRRSRDEFEAWLEEKTGSYEESMDILGQMEAEADARFRAAIPRKELDGIAPAGVHSRDDLDFALYSGFDRSGYDDEADVERHRVDE